MHYILIDEQRRNNCIDFIKGLDISKPFEVEIKDYKKNRTKSQNKLMWLWLPILGNHFGYDKDELHEELKRKFLGVVDVKGLDGVEYQVPRSTRKLKVREFAEYLTKIEILAHANNVLLPVNDDYNYALMRGE